MPLSDRLHAATHDSKTDFISKIYVLWKTVETEEVEGAPRLNLEHIKSQEAEFGGCMLKEKLSLEGGCMRCGDWGGRRAPRNIFAQVLQTATQKRLKCSPVRVV